MEPEVPGTVFHRKLREPEQNHGPPRSKKKRKKISKFPAKTNQSGPKATEFESKSTVY